MKKLLSIFFVAFLGGLVAFFLAAQLFLSIDIPVHETNAQLVKNINISPKNQSVPFDFKDAAKRATPSVVNIYVSGRTKLNSDFFPDDYLPIPEREGKGSGVIYKSNGYIITNNHVVDRAEKIEVKLFDNRIYEAKIVGTDATNDLAVIKIDEQQLPTLEIGDSDQLEVGEWVLAVGNPFDLNFTVTAGIVSAKGRNIELLEEKYAIESFIQTDASINPGNSGGALVDPEGRLLGINTAIATRTGSFQGYAFTIPINLVVRIVDDIIEFGTYKRAYLGITVVDMDSELAEELGIDNTLGVLIQKITEGGAAQQAGLLPNDLVIKVNGKDIKNGAAMQEIVGVAKAGDILNMVIVRNGKIIEMPVELKTQ